MKIYELFYLLRDSLKKNDDNIIFNFAVVLYDIKSFIYIKSLNHLTPPKN